MPQPQRQHNDTMLKNIKKYMNMILNSIIHIYIYAYIYIFIYIDSYIHICIYSYIAEKMIALHCETLSKTIGWNTKQPYRGGDTKQNCWDSTLRITNNDQWSSIFNHLYIHICLYIYILMYIYKGIYTYTYMHIFIYLYIHIFIYCRPMIALRFRLVLSNFALLFILYQW